MTIKNRFVASIGLGVFLIPAVAAQMAAQIPGSPLVPIGQGRVSAIYDFEAVPPYAYALERGFLNILDIRNPAAVREVGSFALNRPRSRAALRFPYLYLTGWNTPLGVIDISRPTRPRWVAEFPELGPTAGGGFELAGDIAYSVRLNQEPGQNADLFLDVLDLVTNPARPERLGTVDLGVRVSGEYGGIAQSEGRVFVVVTRVVGETPRSRLIVIDARVPNRPMIERTLFFPDGALYKNVEVRSGLLYLLQPGSQRDQRTGLAVYRLQEDGQLQRLGEALTSELFFPVDLIVNDDVAYVTFKGGCLLATFDISDPRAPRLVNTYAQGDIWSAGLGMSLVEDRLYVSGDNGPSPILDVSTPRAPRLMGRYEFVGGSVEHVLLEGPSATLVSSGDLFFYDISDERTPRRTGRHNGGVPSSLTSMDWMLNIFAARDGRVVVAHATLPAEVLDVRTPARPRVVATFTPRGRVHAIALTPTHAILGNETRGPGFVTGGIEVVDLRTAGEARVVAALDMGKPVGVLAVHGDRLIAMSRDGEVIVVDLRDPNHPVMLSRLAADGAQAAGVAGLPNLALSADGRRAYVARTAIRAGSDAVGQGTLKVIDLKDPAAPRLEGELGFETSGAPAVPLAVSGTRVVLLSGSSGGVVIVETIDPSRPVVTGTYSLPSSVYACGIAVDHDRVYVAAGEDGLLIYGLPGVPSASPSKAGFPDLTTLFMEKI